MEYTTEGHIQLSNGRLITNPKVINLVAAFDALKKEDFAIVPLLKEKWNISDDPILVPVSIETTPVKEEQTEFNVVLIGISADRMGAIKLIREVTGLSLSDSKNALDKLPYTLKKYLSKAAAEAIETKFKAIGAFVEFE